MGNAGSYESRLRLLARIREAGVTLEVVDGRLAFDAPAGVLTPERLAKLREHKDALIAELRSPSASSSVTTAPSRGPCTHRANPVTRSNGLRNWFGDLVHLRCPELPPVPEPEQFEEVGEPDPQPIAWTYRSDVVAVEDLADEGKRPGRISRELGLTRSEVTRILRRTGPGPLRLPAARHSRSCFAPTVTSMRSPRCGGC